MAAPEEIVDLVNRFDSHRESYISGQYNETQVRREFIDPMFTSLGWDVDNKQGHAEAYKDVIHEDAIEVGGVTKAPDYCFRVGGARKFFLEAKKPSVNIREDIHPAYQLRRYGWSAKLPLSILTDFDEFSVYDCRVKPEKTDKPSHSRILYFKYTDYADQWEKIDGIFSRDAILKGSFDKYVESNRAKKGTTEVDTAFLQEIERWRELLARNIALRNPGLSQRELNFAIQQTIDRIVFLRICEDRGIENYGQLMALQNGTNVYERLFQLFNKADEKYNSGLFHFKKEKGRENFDNLTPSLKIDDNPLKEIFKNLYYPESPYEFSVLSADILGQVYEKFLGKVIRLTPGHQAKIEEKPEVRKAGGVYYTPAYIVDYIVKNTVGKLVEVKKAGPGGGVSHLRILDPACGSGSFLIGAYQFLLDWHQDKYIKDDPGKWSKGKTPRVYQSQKGEWRLTTEERKRILLNNIYGVDIDHQAVEVTKLSLLLKVLEGEDEQSIGKQMRMFQERVLPDLSNNIKCGNSLIGPDFYSYQQPDLFNEEEVYRVNAFDWNAEFAEIMKSGGFDAVIGNPPYIRIQTLKEWAPLEVEIYKQRYTAARSGNYDIYVVFVEKGLNLLKNGGRLGYILPHKFFNAQYGQPLRKLISNGRYLADVVHFGDQQIFAGATTYTCLLFLNKDGSIKCNYKKVDNLDAWRVQGQAVADVIPASSIFEGAWNFSVGGSAMLFEKLRQMPIKLDNVADRIFQGLITGVDSVFILVPQGQNIYFSNATKQEHSLEKELLHPLCKGSINIRRYEVREPIKNILFPYKLINGKGILLSSKELAAQYPLTWAYLLTNKSLLENREHGKWKHDRWYAFGRSQNLSEMEQKKLLTPSIANQASFTLDAIEFYYFVGSGGGGGGGYGITLKPEVSLTYEYVLGLLNSKLLDVYLKSYSSPFSGGYYAYNRQYIEQLPIRTINFNDSSDVARHDQMVGLVKSMLDLNKKLTECKIPQEKELLKRQIESTDRQIDQLVYKLYDLTEEEIKIVESQT